MEITAPPQWWAEAGFGYLRACDGTWKETFYFVCGWKYEPCDNIVSRINTRQIEPTRRLISQWYCKISLYNASFRNPNHPRPDARYHWGHAGYYFEVLQWYLRTIWKCWWHLHAFLFTFTLWSSETEDFIFVINCSCLLQGHWSGRADIVSRLLNRRIVLTVLRY